MGIFDTIRKKKKAPAPAESEQAQTPAESESRPPESVGTEPVSLSRRSVLKRPWVSEKARDMGAAGTYVFLVDVGANKHMVRDEVERRYGVSVTSIHIVRGQKRAKRFAGRTGGKRSFKKAMVTVKPGQKIDIFPI